MVCPHMNQVVSNQKLGDAVLKECETVRYLLHHADFKNRTMRTMRCMDCGEISCGSTFICLQCGFCGCWNNNHFLDHSQKLGHIFGVSSSNGLVFCFRCGDFMADLVAEIPASQWDAVMEKTELPASIHRDGLQGLVNMGSTCFMSSIIQTIIHNPYFVEELLSHKHCNNCDIKSGTKCVSCALDEIACDFYGNGTGTGKSSSVSKGFVNLLSASWHINHHLVGSSQQDAHEYWQFLLNQLHTDHARVFGSSKAPDCQCITHRIFQGYLKNTLQCSQCGFSKTTIDPIMDLSLEIKNNPKLEDCLDHFQREETLTDFHYECQNCKQNQGVVKQLTLHKAPNVLVIQLKRFEHQLNGQSAKLNDRVQFPLHLNLKPHLFQIEDEYIPNIAYDLLNVVSHQGTVDQGHYTTVSKTEDGQWFKFNDSVVTSVTEEQVLEQQAYLLFYIIR
ncbi:Ubp8 [Kluyveromyces lactis]|nr:Ubp8 [Kluyveromyces lactis]